METWKLYNQDIELMFDSDTHVYSVNGQTIQGVTGVLNVIAKPALMYWAVNQACDYLKKNWQPANAYDEIQIQEMLDEAKVAHRKFASKAANIGTLVHEWIEKTIAGENPPLPHNDKAKAACEQFVKWTEENDVQFHLSEFKVYSKKYQYAGTVDFTATVNNKLVIGDIKTSTGIYDEYFLQTAAYQFARQEEYPDEKYEANLIVRCGKDGKLEVKEDTSFEDNFRAFFGALLLDRHLRSKK